MRTVVVVVALVLMQHGCSVSLVDDQEAIESSRRMLPTKRSAIALARGARTGVRMMRTSIAVKTAVKAAVNLASRSRMKTESHDRHRRGP